MSSPLTGEVFLSARKQEAKRGPGREPVQWPPLQLLGQEGLGSLWPKQAKGSQLSGSCLGWGQPQTLAGSLGRSASASPWSTFLTSPPILPLCCGMLQPDLSGTSLFFDGYSQSKKTKTPSLLKSEKPGKSPCNRSLGAHRDPFWLDSLADSRLFGDRSLPKEAAHFIHSSVHPFTHSFIQQKLI